MYICTIKNKIMPLKSNHFRENTRAEGLRYALNEIELAVMRTEHLPLFDKFCKPIYDHLRESITLELHKEEAVEMANRSIKMLAGDSSSL